jgi:hypothetical protein
VSALEEFERVVAYTRAWGIEVKLYAWPTEDLEKRTHRGPIWGVIAWPDRQIWWPPNHPTAVGDWPSALLHELAHCLAPEPPSRMDEVDSLMLAFERCSARLLRITAWEAWMDTYSLPDPHGTLKPWTQLSIQHRGHLLNISRRHARAAGVLDARGMPTFRKPPWCTAPFEAHVPSTQPAADIASA